MKVVMFFRLKEIRWSVSDTDLAAMRAEFPTLEFVAVEEEADLAAALPDAEVFFGWTLPREHFGAMKKLRWMHTPNAGVEANLFPEFVASDVVLTNGTGLHSVSIPEHVLALMLALGRNLHLAARLQARREWNRFGAIAFGSGIRELHGSNLAILGAGAIGASLAERASALGMRVRVLRRRADRPVAGAEAVVGPESMHELLAWADFVVLATPLTAETRNLIDARALDAMKSSAFLINIARGEVVDDDALVDALRRGRIAGAGLDVFREEPLPPESPYWELENAIVTPHVSGYTPGYFEKTLALFRDNLRRYLGGETMRNRVDKRLGYADA